MKIINKSIFLSRCPMLVQGEGTKIIAPLSVFLLGQLCILFATLYFSFLFTHDFFLLFLVFYFDILLYVIRGCKYGPKNFWIPFTKNITYWLHFTPFVLSFATSPSSISQEGHLKVKSRHIMVTPKYVSVYSLEQGNSSTCAHLCTQYKYHN